MREANRAANSPLKYSRTARRNAFTARRFDGDFGATNVFQRAANCAVFFVLVAFVGAAAAATSSPTPDRVLVVYNSNWIGDLDKDGVQDSLQVANYYAAKRGIPSANIIGVPCTNDGGSGSYYYYTNEYGKFNTEVVQPIKTKLTALGSTNIDVIVLCYGVPTAVYTPYSNSGASWTGVDNILMGINFWASDGSNINWSGNPYFAATPGFGADVGHFDHATWNFNGTTMYLVSRLDGPRGVQGALDLVDQALYGERYVAANAGYYNGYGYIDSRFGQGGDGGSTPYTDAYLAAQPDVQTGNYGSYNSADLCMAYGEHFVTASGLPLKWENTTTKLQIGQAGATYSDGSSALTAPRALMYGGWYNYGTYNDVWSWLPGSVVCDLNSNSLDASKLRVAGGPGSFGCSALARGATCVSGVVSEPYLTGHPQPDTLLYYMFKGYTFAEAAALSTPAIGWMPINVGDPLYAPFKSKTLVKDTQAPALAAGYPAISLGAGPLDRVVNLLVNDSPEPDVAQVTIDYGTTTAYGSTVTSGQGFWRRFALTLPSLLASTTYHYRITLTDPAGNVTVLGDMTFSTNTTPPAITSAAPAAGAVGSLYTYSATATGSPTPLWRLSSAPSGMSVDRASGVVTWTPGSTGTFPVTLVADNGVAPAASQTWSITVSNALPTFTLTVVSGSGSGSYTAGTVVPIVASAPPPGQVFQQWTGAAVASPTSASTTLTMPAANTTVTAAYIAAANSPPTLTSSATATPARAPAGTSISFSAAASDADGDTLNFSWAFGDTATGTGSSASHSYTAAGTFTATVTISDGHGNSVTSSVNVIVDPAGSGGGGGGGGSGGGSGGGGGSGNAIPFTLKTMRGTMTKSGGHDGCSIAGVVPGLPAQFNPTGLTAILNAGGASDTFTLDKRGHAHNNHGAFALTLKLTRNKTTHKSSFAGGNAKFTATLAKGSWAAAWAAAGMNINATAQNVAETLTISLTLNGQLYQIPASVLYTAKSGHGSFKKK